MKTRMHILTAGVLLAALTTGLSQPIIIQQPQSCTSIVGATATFIVGVKEEEPLTYQWQKCDLNTGIWTDLNGCTEFVLVLANVQASHEGDYRVIVTDIYGAVTSDVARLTVKDPPRIVPSTLLQHIAVDLGKRANFLTVLASGTPPLSYQWRRDGADLAGKTNASLIFNSAQPADEGDYTVIVTNLAGAATSGEPARLWVVPPASTFIKGNFTNAMGRLPYFYLLPTNYSAARTYPLWLNFHGSSFDETVITTPNYGWPGLAEFPGTKTFASYRQQERNPVIFLWPTRRAGDSAWTSAYLSQAVALLDQFVFQFSVDTNRIFVMGWSGGGSMPHGTLSRCARAPLPPPVSPPAGKALPGSAPSRLSQFGLGARRMIARLPIRDLGSLQSAKRGGISFIPSTTAADIWTVSSWAFTRLR